MNKPIRRLAIFALALFGVLLVNITWIQAFAAQDLREHPENTRRAVDRLNQQRGPIVAGGEEIAYSEPLSKESDNYQRKYENGELYSHVVGTFRPSGETGIEEYENSLLNGSDDRLAVSNFMDTITGKEKKGASVDLTIDPEVQQAAMDGLRETGKNGAAIALNPETGAVLASVSVPSFDPNSVVGLDDTEAAAENWEDLSSDEKQPLLNRGLNQRYPPGSTFKVVTAATALENGASPDSTMEAPAELDLGGELPNAWEGPCNGGDPDPLGHSIERSCNTSMANWAMELGADKMTEQAEAFGFNGEEFNTPLSVTPSKYPREEDRNFLGRSGIGQAHVEATPLQMAMVASGVANDGEVMKPYMVDKVQDSDLTTIEEATPEVHSDAVSSSTADDLTQMMVRVTEGDQASGENGAIPGMQVAGKTGTAENSGPTHNWFISFAPADDPQIATAVVVEHGDSFGGKIAAPISRDMMEAVIDE